MEHNKIATTWCDDICKNFLFVFFSQKSCCADDVYFLGTVAQKIKRSRIISNKLLYTQKISCRYQK